MDLCEPIRYYVSILSYSWGMGAGDNGMFKRRAMTKKKARQILYEKQARIARAIAHPVRVAAVDCLKGGEHCVCDIAEYVGSERSNVSRHLSIMVSAGILQSRKDGLKVMYKLKTPCVTKFMACMTDVVKHQAKENEGLLKMM